MARFSYTARRRCRRPSPRWGSLQGKPQNCIEDPSSPSVPRHPSCWRHVARPSPRRPLEVSARSRCPLNRNAQKRRVARPGRPLEVPTSRLLRRGAQTGRPCDHHPPGQSHASPFQRHSRAKRTCATLGSGFQCRHPAWMTQRRGRSTITKTSQARSNAARRFWLPLRAHQSWRPMQSVYAKQALARLDYWHPRMKRVKKARVSSTMLRTPSHSLRKTERRSFSFF